MAKLYFDASDTSLTISNSNTEVIGLSGTGVQSVTIAQDVTNVTLRQNVEKLVLNGASSAFKYQQAGATLKIYKTDGTTLVATVPVQGGSADIDGDGTLITFTNGTASAKLTSGVMSLGGTTVSTTIGDVTPTLTGGATPITFSLDKDSYDVVEGQTLTFTIKASAPVQSATTVRYNIAGDMSVVGQEARAGTDFSPASASLSFASGESEKVVTITVPNDGATEGFEGMKISLLSSSFSLLDSALATIEDGPELAKTMSLTTSGDNFVGTTQDDTFLGTLAMSSGGSLNADSTTLNTNDTLTGGAGIDTLNISVRGNASTGGTLETAIPQIKGIEKIFISSDVTSNTGEGIFGINLSSTDSSLTDIGVTPAFTNSASTAFFQLVPANVDVTLRGQGDTAIKYQSGVMSGTADTLDLTLNGVGQSATGLSAFGVNGGGVETLHITSSTSANYLLLNGGLDHTTERMQDLQKVTVDGTQSLYLDLNSDTGTGQVSLDANGFSGNLTVEGISTGAVTLTGGAGNDTFNFGSSFDAGTGTSKDSLVGGDGTDTLQVIANVTDAQLKNVSSVETLYLAASGVTGTLDANADAAGIVTVQDATGNTSNISLTVGTGFDNALTVQLYGTGADTVNASGSQSTLTVKGTLANLAGDTLTAGTGTGTTDILSLTTDGSTGTLGAGITRFEKIVLEGASSGLTLTTDDANVASGATLIVDASAITSSTASFTFTGSAEADGKFSLLGGAGNDTLYLGSGNDTVAGGAGNDSINASAGGNDSIQGGAGNDTINMGTTLSSGDTIDGGDGVDTLTITNSSVTSAQFTNVSGVETLNLSATSVTLSSNISFTTFDLTDTGTQTALTFGTGYTSASTVALASGDSVINTAGIALTVNVSDASGVSGATGALLATGGTGIDIVNITADNTSGNITLGTGSKIDTVNILDSTGTGDHDVYLYATGGYVGNLKVDATQLDAGTSDGSGGLVNDETLIFSAASATGSITVLGGAGADTIIVGNGADSVDGGAGNDTLVAGSGNDYIQGGDGNDRIIFGTGTGGALEGYFSDQDTVVGGAGTDTLVLTATTSSLADVNFLNSSAIEILELSSGSTGAVNLGTYAKAAGITTIKLAASSDTNYSVAADSSYNSVGMTFDLNQNTGNVSLQGAGGNDTFIIQGSGVLDANDSLKGLNGTDTIRIDNNTAAGNTGAGTAVFATVGSGVTGIEQIIVNDLSTGTSGDVTLNFSGYTATGTLTIDASSLDSGEVFTLTATGFGTGQALSVLGGGADDVIQGGSAKDTMDGGAGADSVFGWGGNDSLSGGAGADTLVGGAGADTLTGGDGNDIFYFGSGDSNGTTTDSVTDFTVGSDQVQFVLNASNTSGSSFIVDATDRGLTAAGGSDVTDPNFAGGKWTAGHIGQYVFSNGSTNKQLVIDSDGNAAYQGTDGLISLPNLTGISDTDLRFEVNVVGIASTGSITLGAGVDTLNFTSGTGGAVANIVSGLDIIGAGSTGVDTVNLNYTGNDTITVFATGGTDQFGGTGGVDVLSLASGGRDTIVFGTGALGGGTGDNFGLTINSFSVGAGSSGDVLDLSQLVTGTSFFGTNTGGGSWLNLNGASGSFSGSGEGVIFVYSSGAGANDLDFTSGNLETTGSLGAGELRLGTGDFDTIIIVATGTADTSLEVYTVNPATDGTATNITNGDIKLIGLVNLFGGDSTSFIGGVNIDITD